MDQALLQKVNRQVYRKFPEFRGVKPKVQASRRAGEGQDAVLIYRRRVTTEDGQRLTRVLRVVVRNGRILRMLTSR